MNTIITIDEFWNTRTFQLTNQLHALWNPEVQCRTHKVSPIVPILSRINHIPRIDTYFFKIILILSYHLHLGLPKGLFLVDVPVKILEALLPLSFLATWLAHLNILDLITLLGERYKLWSSSLWSLLHFPFSSLLSPNIRLRILFSNTLSLQSSLNVRDHASHQWALIFLNVMFHAPIGKFQLESKFELPLFKIKI
jgi:hypothetical protein